MPGKEHKRRDKSAVKRHWNLDVGLFFSCTVHFALCTDYPIPFIPVKNTPCGGTVHCKPRAVIRLPVENLAKVGDLCLLNNVIFTAEYAEEMFGIGNRE